MDTSSTISTRVMHHRLDDSLLAMIFSLRARADSLPSPMPA
jgi:hypothetical protein